ncbi:hypothetical protein P40081_33280 [Paenibacillus sp. FSL P4-0081]|nr:hypothetical protein P40081_33280 [Paenibacillus sp. FSL P4-0081]
MQLDDNLIKNRRLLVILLLLISNMVLLSVLQMFGYDFVPCFFDFYQEAFFGLFMKKLEGQDISLKFRHPQWILHPSSSGNWLSPIEEQNPANG